ncbi:MAG TPA: hypothetical protein VGF53_07000 [Pseudolabrys sp.]|jgi:hypothetical protein
MLRLAMAPATIAVFISLGIVSALAQTASPKPKYPAEIAAASKRLAQKQEDCRLEAKRQKLGYLKRRSFMRACVKKTP